MGFAIHLRTMREQKILQLQPVLQILRREPPRLEPDHGIAFRMDVIDRQIVGTKRLIGRNAHQLRASGGIQRHGCPTTLPFDRFDDMLLDEVEIPGIGHGLYLRLDPTRPQHLHQPLGPGAHGIRDQKDRAPWRKPAVEQRREVGHRLIGDKTEMGIDPHHGSPGREIPRITKAPARMAAGSRSSQPPSRRPKS